MHSHHSSSQFADTVNNDLCLICFQKMNRRLSVHGLVKRPLICDECLKQFVFSDEERIIESVPCRVLYQQNDFISSLYDRYAKMYDYALKDALIAPFYEELKDRYKDDVLVTLAGDEKENEKRMFAVCPSIVECFHPEYLLMDEQGQLKGGEVLHDRSVLFFGGVLRDVSAVQKAMRMISFYQPKNTYGLFLFYDE